MRISDWSLDVCSSDLLAAEKGEHRFADVFAGDLLIENIGDRRQEAGRAAEQGVPEDARVRADLVAGDRAVEGRDHRDMLQLGGASCRERGCQCVWSWGVAVSLKKKDDRYFIYL